MSDAAIADGFGVTYDHFEEYSYNVMSKLNLSVSAPHQYWGWHFFTQLGLRDSCQVGHALMHAMDFTLGRYLPARVDARSRCRYGEQWRPLWQPPPAHGRLKVCDAAALPGYVTACPGTSPRPISYRCE